MRRVVRLILALLLTAPAWAEIYTVDQKHPRAADDNPGSNEQPWKTIGHAIGIARAGDTVRIRPGRYREGGLLLTHTGERVMREPPGYAHRLNHPLPKLTLRYLTFAADGAEPVILDGSVELPADTWQPVPERPGLWAAPVAAHGWPRGGGREDAPHQITWVFLNDQPLVPHVLEQGITGGNVAKRWKPVLGIPEAPDVEQWYHDVDKGLLYVNFGGRTPAEAGRVEAAVYPGCLQAGHNQYVVLQGLTIQRYNSRTVDFSRTVGGIVRDCLFRHCGEAINAGMHSIVRRNTIVDANSVGIYAGSYSMIDENLVIRNFRDMLQTRNGYQATAITYFGHNLIRFRNNVVLESPGNGFWPDCPSNGHVHYGNSVGYCKGNGFYIECPAFQNVVMNNVCFHNANGIYLRQNMHNIVSENYVIGGGSGVVLACTENAHYRMRNNLVAGNWLRDVRVGVSAGSAPYGAPQNLNLTDRNVFDPSVATVAVWAGTPFKTLKDFRAATGNETHGRVAPIDEQELGLVSFRVAESSRPWEPVKMFGNPTTQRQNWGAITDEPYFWHYGTADGDEDQLWRSVNDFATPVTPVDPTNGGALRVIGEPHFWVAADAADMRAIQQRHPAPDSGTILEVRSLPDQVISSRGVGFWSVSLPTTSGAVMHVRMQARLRDVQATAPGGGLLVFAEWSDATRRQVQREWLAGRDETGQAHATERITGTHDFAPIEGTVTAPPWARRFRLFFGLRDCTGAAAFDDIDRMEVEPCQAPAAIAAPEAPEAQPRPLRDPATLDFSIVDLSGVVNRPLRDEKAGDGQGGWTDQGAAADMNNLTPGRKEFQGVPFEILHPNSIVVLRSPARPQSSTLPERVTIPVDRRADVLYFLHDCAWTTEKTEHYRFLVKYADATSVTIPIVGGVHVFDWAAGHQAKFLTKTDGMRPSVAATFGGGATFAQVNVYLLEWLNPEPDKTIAAIEFIASGRGVPILLGVTIGRRR